MKYTLFYKINNRETPDVEDPYILDEECSIEAGCDEEAVTKARKFLSEEYLFPWQKLEEGSYLERTVCFSV